MKKLLAFLVILLMPPVLQAAISYDENVHGDLSYEAPIEEFSAAPGTNTVSGTATVGTVLDADVFQFLIPEGYGAELSIFSSTDSGGSPYTATFLPGLSIYAAEPPECTLLCVVGFRPIAGSVLLLDPFLPNSEQIAPIENQMLLGSGLYRFGVTGALIHGADTQERTFETFLFSYDYSVRLTVTSVPIPPAGGLLAPCLVAFLFRKQEKSNKAINLTFDRFLPALPLRSVAVKCRLWLR